MTRIGDTKCPSCTHYRLIAPYAPTPICVKAANPQACVLVLRRVAEPCPHWSKR